MKLHSDILTESDIREALAKSRRRGYITGGVEVLTCDPKGSRSRANGFEVRIGVDHADGVHKRRTNDGTRNYAATYDEWGWFIAELFSKDEHMIFGHYKGWDSFLTQTRYAYEVGL